MLRAFGGEDGEKMRQVLSKTEAHSKRAQKGRPVESETTSETKENPMPMFHYEAMDASGGEISDTLRAADQKAANAELRARGYFVTRLRQVCPHCGTAVRKAADRCDDCGQWLAEQEEGSELGHRPEPQRGMNAAADEALNAKLLDLLHAGLKLDAIKVHREATRSSLAESKAHVDSLIRRHGLPDAGRGGCLPVLALLLTTAAAAMTTAWLAGLVASM